MEGGRICFPSPLLLLIPQHPGIDQRQAEGAERSLFLVRGVPFYNSADSLMGCMHLPLLSSLWQSVSKDLTSPHTCLNFLLLASCRSSHRHQQNSSSLKPYSFLSTQGLYWLCAQLLNSLLPNSTFSLHFRIRHLDGLVVLNISASDQWGPTRIMNFSCFYSRMLI